MDRPTYDFLKAGTALDTGVYLAGDSVGFLGGWVENALQTGVNAAAAVAVSLRGALNNFEQSPFQQLDPTFYTYAVTPTTTRPPKPATIRVPGMPGRRASVALP